MQQPRRILVPVDLSERAEAAVGYAAMLADATDAELLLMTNVSHPESDALADFASAEHLSIEEAARATVRRIISDNAPDAQTTIVLRHQASAADAILEVAAEESVDLIVLASHGRSGMTRWMLGSVAEKVSRHAEVPVTIVPARGHEVRSYGT